MITIKPMLTKIAAAPPASPDYVYEIKWDGIRAICYLEYRKIKILSRNGFDITKQYPELEPLTQTLSNSTAILDGEIVALNDQGFPSFSLLQHRMGVVSPEIIAKKTQAIPVTYMIFDILYLADKSLIHKPYTERRKILENISLVDTHWNTPTYQCGDGNIILAASRKLNLEGIIAKHKDSIYLPGKRTNYWLKIKNQKRQEFVIGGWMIGKGSRENTIGSLLVGYYDRDHLRYAGNVGSGFDTNTLTMLEKKLESIRIFSSPFCSQINLKNVFWVSPLLVCEVEFTEWTKHGTLRHPSFKGFRFDKEPRAVHKEVM